MFKILLVASLVANLAAISIGAQEVKDLIVKEVKVGTGKEAKDGNTVTVHYTGTLTMVKSLIVLLEEDLSALYLVVAK